MIITKSMAKVLERNGWASIPIEDHYETNEHAGGGKVIKRFDDGMIEARWPMREGPEDGPPESIAIAWDRHDPA